MRPRTRLRASFATVLFTTTLAVLAFGWVATASAVDPGYPLWMRAYSGSGVQQFTDVVGCPDGDVLVAGIVSTGVQHVVLARYAPSGARRWLKVIDSSNTTADYLDELTVDGAGNAVVTFTRTVDPGVSSNIVACRYSPTGRRLWRRTLDGGAGALNSAAGLAVNSAGDVYIGGSVTVPGPAQGSLVARLRARDGAVVMRSMQSGVGKLEVCTAIAVDAKGYSYATGYGDRGDGKTQAVTVKVNPGAGSPGCERSREPATTPPRARTSCSAPAAASTWRRARGSWAPPRP